MGGIGVALGLYAWHNPAGLARAKEIGISGSVSAYGLTIDNVDNFVDAGPIRGSLENRSIDMFPASLDFVKPLGSVGDFRHAAGLSVVVPDFDQFDGTAAVPRGELAFELKARRQAVNQTFWVLPAWGACTPEGNVCFGGGPTIAVHMESDLTLQTLSAAYEDGSTLDYGSSFKADTKAAAAGGQLGFQIESMNHVWAGLTVRTPVFPVWGSGSVLAIDSVVDTSGMGSSYVDRGEVLAPTVAYRQPWRFAAGLGMEEPGSFSVGIDVKVTLPQSRYLAVGGEHGEMSLQPMTVAGEVIEDPDRALPVGRAVETVTSINVNVGGEYYVTPKLVLQAGFFTDKSSTPLDAVERGDELDRLSRLGASLGAGIIGEDSATWVAIVGSLGRGDALGFDENFDPMITRLESKAIMVMLGSSAKLGGKK
jgi:hypothetical protein